MSFKKHPFLNVDDMRLIQGDPIVVKMMRNKVIINFKKYESTFDQIADWISENCTGLIYMNEFNGDHKKLFFENVDDIILFTLWLK